MTCELTTLPNLLPNSTFPTFSPFTFKLALTCLGPTLTSKHFVPFSKGACSERNAIANLVGSARNWAPDLESRIKVQPGRASGTLGERDRKSTRLNSSHQII